jgi:Zn-dependent protease
MDDPIIVVKLCVIALVIYSTSLHELAHAFSADYFGDPTPGRHGRLTFNPIPHLSPVLTAIVLPLVFYLSNNGLLCLAATPVNPSRFRRPMRDYALVSLSGPLMNFLLAGVMIGILWIPGVWQYPMNYTMLVLEEAAWWNVVLGVFNLLPIPPLDGYAVIRGALPLQVRMQADALARSSASLLLALFVGSYALGSILGPVFEVFRRLFPG